MLSLVLAVLYTCLLLFFLHNITRRDRPYLSSRQLSVSFVVKIIFGMAYGYLFMRFYGGDDTWKYHTLSLTEYQKLLHHPLQFLHDTLSETGGSFSLDAAYSTTNSFWSDFEEVLFIRLLVLFDVLSFGSYYVNVVLFCFIAYLGHLLLFRLLVIHAPRSASFLRAGIFYYPVVLFWLSGIRKEGLLLLGMATVLFYFNRLMQQNTRILKPLLLCVTGLLLLWLIRNLVVLCLAPALLACGLHQRGHVRARFAYPLVYLLCAGLFFSGHLLPRFPDMAQKLVDRQYSFLALQGNTRLPLDSLHASFSSYAKVLPQALNHSFFSTHPMAKQVTAATGFSAGCFFYFLGLECYACITGVKIGWPRYGHRC